MRTWQLSAYGPVSGHAMSVYDVNTTEPCALRCHVGIRDCEVVRFSSLLTVL